MLQSHSNSRQLTRIADTLFLQQNFNREHFFLRFTTCVGRRRRIILRRQHLIGRIAFLILSLDFIRRLRGLRRRRSLVARFRRQRAERMVFVRELGRIRVVVAVHADLGRGFIRIHVVGRRLTLQNSKFIFTTHEFASRVNVNRFRRTLMEA